LNNLLNVITEKFNQKINVIEHIEEVMSQKEDWFLTELSYLLKDNKDISDLTLEYKIERKGIDLNFKYDSRSYFVELKHWTERCKNISSKTGYSSFKLSSYLGAYGQYWKNDFEKLNIVKNKFPESKCCFMVFYTPNTDNPKNMKSSIDNFITNIYKGDDRINYFLKEGKDKKYYIILFVII